MDGTRFDGLSRLLAGACSRRGALKAALGLIAGGSALAVGEASARPALCRPAGRYCTSNRQCCNNRCRIGKRVPLASRNICDCDAPQAMCGKMCRDLSSDPNHCGGCGNKIDRDSELCCDGVPTAIDEANCHACGEVCGPDDVCCGPEIGCAASCEPEATCVGRGAIGAPCQGAADCCSLACGIGGCIEPYAVCSTYTGADLPVGETGYCYRLFGQSLGVTGVVSGLPCSGAVDEPNSYTDQPCSSSDECQAYAVADGLQNLIGLCLDEAYLVAGGQSKPLLVAPLTKCYFLNRPDATCPN